MRGSKKGSVRRKVAVGSVERLKEYCLAKGCRRKVILDYFQEKGTRGVGVGGGRVGWSGGNRGGKEGGERCCDVCDGRITPNLPKETKERKGRKGGGGKKGKRWGARTVKEGEKKGRAPRAPRAPRQPRKRAKAGEKGEWRGVWEGFD